MGLQSPSCCKSVTCCGLLLLLVIFIGVFRTIGVTQRHGMGYDYIIGVCLPHGVNGNNIIGVKKSQVFILTFLLSY